MTILSVSPAYFVKRARFSVTAKDSTDATQPPTAVASTPTGATFDTSDALVRHAMGSSGGGGTDVTAPTDATGRTNELSDVV